jgi:hypothetical protein
MFGFGAGWERNVLEISGGIRDLGRKLASFIDLKCRVMVGIEVGGRAMGCFYVFAGFSIKKSVSKAMYIY